jgi:Flp pilus assembly protein TadD
VPKRIFAIIVASWLPVVVTPATAADLTFNKDIAPLLWTRCGACHRTGASAPFSLIDYKEVVPRARQIVAATRNRTMPPWLPEPGDVPFANDRRLRQDEIDLIDAWVKQGARQGDVSDLPARPAWSEGWQLGTPDLVVELPDAYVLRPGARDEFRTFVLPVPLASARYVRGLEVRPGNARVVHHAALSVDRTRASRRLDDADPEPGFGGGMFSPGARSPGSRALGWTPGMTPSMEPEGMAWRIEKDTDLVVQLHMLPSREGKTERVKPSVGLYFTDVSPTRPTLDFKLGSKAIDIPPGKADFVVEDGVVLPVAVQVVSLYPHAHYLAKEMTATATLPDGSAKTLLAIKGWDFHWQDEYCFAVPLALPAGTTLTMRYTYDNSAANKHNPAKTPVRVVFGPLSSDEMGDLWLRLLPGSASDGVSLARLYREHELGKDIAIGERLTAEHPRDGKLHSALGVSYIDAGKLVPARLQLEEAIRLAPELPDAQTNLGRVLELDGKVTEALPHFREAVRLAPDNDLVHLNLANALQDIGELEEAMAHFRRTIALNPAAADAHNNLGVALGSTGRLIEAEREFRQALEIQPDYADAQQNLRMLLELK